MRKPILISGIQPTGKLHLGNYLGALKNFVDLQNSGKYQCYFFIADMHALTENPNPKDLQKNTIDLMASFLAARLNPKKSTLFIQSQISAHLQLYEILGPLTPVSELLRMTAFKEKVIQTLKLKEGQIFTREDFERAVDESNFGLAAYPVLMTADIILYDAKFVPVGRDQLQHLELARTLVRKFNNKYGKTFTEPKPLLTKVPRLMSLDDSTKKMAKSRPAGCLFMDDSPAIIRQKLTRATTDSGKEIKYDVKNKPGVSNLLLIYSELSGKSVSTIEKMYVGKGYAEFKKDLAEVIIRALRPFQERKKKLKPAEIKKVLAVGNKKANTVASKKINEVKRKIGLLI
ncbi:MAG: Tryptophan-tRNA ligase [Candidatus Jorgensenbacteria bacterium GW2011_GWA1_48_13]|uniref:Tryptophan--tRNA ligase n=2 Tax=Candidatus Joergenseniibacteriota TaxID=1752739 RepID=A0A0G1YK05_9BACT|nr:MAG: Tryptophan-tRNA ligase [Candidatus Jorgensenbacteria bacterium GW2011_GWA1_48_13]KKU98829.1 MAG: tryptophanyl-tRNA synthetase, tryptophanyl-tRNA synthetase [Candidatus Jorgensenbacteria bacterium GW2011_GWC1_48_8]KKW15337.1 MAG: Tryptophan-tRNA ligase [Candidatus Jorgensenbacteria bacterium GW2011_GWB1_50_10]